MSQSITEIRDELKRMKKLITAGYAFADTLISRAAKERDKKGYRENLGYDQKNKLSDKISELQTEYYQDYCNILDYFRRRCDSL